jgi:hypothetical protein
MELDEEKTTRRERVSGSGCSSGAVIAGTLGGWSCQAPEPAQFDGTYFIELMEGRSYSVYAGPLDLVVAPSNVSPAPTTLCRNFTADRAGQPHKLVLCRLQTGNSPRACVQG